MTDVFDRTKRSEVMSLIRASGNRETEVRLINILKAHRITGWRRKYPIYGKPDIVFPKQRVAVFVDGCFWHGCTAHYIAPKNNREFWARKLDVNRTRDEVVNSTLRGKNWSVCRIWEHELRDEGSIAKKVNEFLKIE